jgi:hypothetical protein
MTNCTACPGKEQLLAIPSAAAAGTLINVHKISTSSKSRKEGRDWVTMYTHVQYDISTILDGLIEDRTA